MSVAPQIAWPHAKLQTSKVTTMATQHTFTSTTCQCSSNKSFASNGSCNLTPRLCAYLQKPSARPRVVSPPLGRFVASQQTKVWLLYWGQKALFFTCILTSETSEMTGLLFSGTLEVFTAPVQSEINNTAHFQGHQTTSACLLDKYVSTLDRRHLTRHSFQSRPQIMTFSCRRCKVCRVRG